MKKEYEYDKLFKGLIIGSGEYISPIIKHLKDPESLPHAAIYDLNVNTVLDNQKITLQLWNLASQHRFRTITNSYYRSAHIILVVFSFTDQTSFSEAKAFVSEIERYAPENVVKILVATDAELISERSVDSSTAKEFAENNGLDLFEVNSNSRDSVMQLVTAGIQRAVANFPQVDRASIAEAHVEELEPEGGNIGRGPGCY